MKIRNGRIVPLCAAGVAVLAVALSITAAGAASQAVTLGSTSGTPSANICLASINCTYVPFTAVSNPALQVPFEGTVTSFSVNAGSAGGIVKLRVLRPAASGQYSGAGTSPAETLSIGVNTFAVSLPVKTGDLLGLDNESSAPMFDTSSASPITAYYEGPSLADGKTAAPNQTRTGYRLLLSATVQQASATTGTTPTVTTPAGTAPTSTPPTVTDLTQSNTVWREGNKLAVVSRKHRPPVGTTFSFSLNEQASVSSAFTQQVGGRKVKGKCIAQTSRNRRERACRLTLVRATGLFTDHAGTNKVSFQGRVTATTKLKPGSYTLVIVATNEAGQHSAAKQLSFTIVS